MRKQEIIIYGASGFGREVAWLIDTCGTFKVVCFTDDDTTKHDTLLNDIPVIPLAKARETFPTAQLICAVGIPSVREAMIRKAASLGLSFHSIIHPKSEYSKFIEIGVGCIICAGTILTTNITLGDHVHVNLNCTIGHDVILDDYSTLAPGVHVSGCVRIGRRTYVGTGAVIINGTQDKPVVIGEDAVIGAGACVTSSIPAGQTWVGIPARPIRD